MNNMKGIALSIAIFLSAGLLPVIAQYKTTYPGEGERKRSPGNTTYYIDPQKGNDQHTGKSAGQAWKTFQPVNLLVLAPGDKVQVLSPGAFNESLMLVAKGSSSKPVVIDFTPGRYDFYRDGTYKTTFHISNTNDVPDSLKAIALYIFRSKFVTVRGHGASLVMRGKMIETCINESEHIRLEGLQYDYHRPTMSELKVIGVNDRYADLLIHPDSKYSITDSVLTWEGEGWRHQPGWYWQVFDPANGTVARTGVQMEKVRFAAAGGDTVRAFFPANPGFTAGMIYQTRDVVRDCTGMFLRRSNHIQLQNLQIHFMHGMGIVAQFCENIRIDSVSVKPADGSGRTSAAWADILHFSGCRGLISVTNSYLSAANDDAINVHGTHLRIVGQPAPNQVKVRFMHGQTYGFDAFIPGDSIDFIHANTLLPFGTNRVTKVSRLDDHELLLTLSKPVPADVQPEDVIENTTWTPALLVRNTTITSIPTRGILVTTRRKVVIEQNNFLRTQMSAILVADDAASWFESGLVRDITIRNNRFIHCGGPVINIHPENRIAGGPVHRNISVLDNYFELNGGKLLSARNAANILLSRNSIKTARPDSLGSLVELSECPDANLLNDNILTKE